MSWRKWTELARREVSLTVCQAERSWTPQVSVWTTDELCFKAYGDDKGKFVLDDQLHDLPVGDGVREDVSLPQAAIVMGTGLAFSKPGDDTRVAEPTNQQVDDATTSTPTCDHSWSDEDPSGTEGIWDTHAWGPDLPQTESRNLPDK